MEKIENGFNFEDIFGHKLYDYIGKTPKKNGDPREIMGFYTRYPFLNNEDVKKWINAKLNKYSRTGKDPANFKITSYLSSFQKYLEFYDIKNPSELLEENIDDRNNRLLHFLGELIRSGVNQVTVRNNYQAMVKSFYSSRGSPLSDGLPTMDSGINRNEIELDKDTIIQIANKLERPEYKIILKCMALLGLRISDVLEELSAENNGQAKYTLRKYEDHYYISKFWTQKEDVIINFLFLPRELEKLLSATYSVKNLEELDLRTVLKTRNGTPIKTYDFLERVKLIAAELGITENVKNHSFRKYFSNQISSINLLKYNAKIGADFENIFKEHLMGHKSNDLSKSYKQKLTNIAQYYELWKPIERAICIDYEIIDITPEEIRDLKARITDLTDENSTLKGRMDKMEKNIEEMAKFLRP